MATRIQPSRINPNKQKDYIIVWINEKTNIEDSDTQNIRTRLNEIVNKVILVTEPEECIHILQEFNGIRSFVITSGALGQNLLPQIHSIHNLEAIFIFCDGEKSYNERWSKEWIKIRQVTTNIETIYQTLSELLHQVKNDEIGMSFIQIDENISTDGLRQLEPSFMFTGLLKETFLTMEFTSKHKKTMVESFLKQYKDDTNEKRIINDFDKNYQSHQAIWWYTRECFVFNYVNQALRDLEGDMIIDMGFFIHDLHKQIEQLHKKQLTLFDDKHFIVYRGQGLSIQAFEKAKKSIGGLLGFNCFLSTSMNKSISLAFAEKGSRRSECMGVLFVMKIDPSLDMVQFANIKEQSYFPTEDEILFTMHTIFKIGEFKKISDYNNIFEVSLELTNEDDPRLQGLKRYMVGQCVTTPEHRLANILLSMGQNEKAQEIYLELLEKTTNEQDRGVFNHCLGLIKDTQGKYEEAINYYEKSIEIDRRILSENDPSIATTYNCIASVYDNMGDYSKALSNYERSLEMYGKSLPKDHPDIATLYNNIGGVYDNMGDHSRALSNYGKSLEIKKKSLPKDHPNIATAYSNIGTVYYSMKKYKKALEYLEEARRIYMISLPHTHPSIKTVNDSIAIVKEENCI